MPSYATPADVTSRYDIRRLSQFLSDTGSPVCTDAEVKSGACAVIISTNVNLLTAIRDASNKVLMSCRVANRYLQADLDSIYASDDRKDSLVRLVCDLVFGYVMMRRGLGLREVYNLAPGFKESLDTLEQLKNGFTVFDDAPPPGTDAPQAGAEALNVAAPGGPNSRQTQCVSLWTQQVCPIFPGPNNGGYGGGGGY